MACLEESFHPRQHHALAVAAEIARAQSGREHLAIHARQLALEPRLQILRRHPRPLLLRLEQAHRHALENHVHRDQRLGLPVMIIKTWYYAFAVLGFKAFSSDPRSNGSAWINLVRRICARTRPRIPSSLNSGALKSGAESTARARSPKGQRRLTAFLAIRQDDQLPAQRTRDSPLASRFFTET